jgi:hypothetical protein
MGFTIWGGYPRMAAFFKDNAELIRGHYVDPKKEPKRLLHYSFTKMFI